MSWSIYFRCSDGCSDCKQISNREFLEWTPGIKSLDSHLITQRATQTVPDEGLREDAGSEQARCFFHGAKEKVSSDTSAWLSVGVRE